MIRAIIWRDADSRIRRFSVRGHAEAAEYGQDIVCAAVSMLVINAINSAEKLLGVTVASDEQAQPGDVACTIPALQGTDDEKLQLLFEAMVYGIEQVAEQYPDFVKRTEKKH